MKIFSFNLETKRQGFTLVELLVVIAVIGLLASIVLVALNSSRIKARDTKRAADVKQLSTAIQLYVDDNNGAFPSNAGCLNGWCCLGHGNSGTCWNGNYNGSTTLDSSLSPKYVSRLPDDPLNNTSKYGDAYMYRVDTDANGSYATLHWGIENANPSADKECLGGSMGNWGAGYGIGANYYCMFVVR